MDGGTNSDESRQITRDSQSPMRKSAYSEKTVDAKIKQKLNDYLKKIIIEEKPKKND